MAYTIGSYGQQPQDLSWGIPTDPMAQQGLTAALRAMQAPPAQPMTLGPPPVPGAKGGAQQALQGGPKGAGIIQQLMSAFGQSGSSVGASNALSDNYQGANWDAMAGAPGSTVPAGGSVAPATAAPVSAASGAGGAGSGSLISMLMSLIA